MRTGLRDGADTVISGPVPEHITSGACREGGACDPQLNTECQPPDYHCSKCGRYMGPA